MWSFALGFFVALLVVVGVYLVNAAFAVFAALVAARIAKRKRWGVMQECFVSVSKADKRNRRIVIKDGDGRTFLFQFVAGDNESVLAVAKKWQADPNLNFGLLDFLEKVLRDADSVIDSEVE